MDNSSSGLIVLAMRWDQRNGVWAEQTNKLAKIIAATIATRRDVEYDAAFILMDR
jgi:hypothetical protein